jgi:hypothetical protein
VITNLELLFASANSYSAVISGNGGEDELVISVTPGQDGNTVVAATAISVDGGPVQRVEFSASGSRNGYPMVRTDHLQHAVRQILTNWSCSGITPTEAERARNDTQIAAITRTLSNNWVLV